MVEMYDGGIRGLFQASELKVRVIQNATDIMMS